MAVLLLLLDQRRHRVLERVPELRAGRRSGHVEKSARPAGERPGDAGGGGGGPPAAVAAAEAGAAKATARRDRRSVEAVSCHSVLHFR